MKSESEAVEIGIGLPQSDASLEFIKRHNLTLYAVLIKRHKGREIDFTDVMIEEDASGGIIYYSCSICLDRRLYTSSFGHARQHFEIHLLNDDMILQLERKKSSTLEV